MNASNSALAAATIESPNIFTSDSEQAHRCIIVDGLNVIRLPGRDRPRLEILLHVLLEVAIPALDFMCIFDANTWHELHQRQGRHHADAYARLCRDFSYHFIECTGGTSADQYILSECEARKGHVISNDKYRDYEAAHPWIGTRSNRFLRLNRFRDFLYVGEARIPLRGDLNSLVRALSDRLKGQPADVA